MASCTECAFAKWDRTKNGHLHPSGHGKCTWDGWKEWRLPPALYFLSSCDPQLAPKPYGGHINRKELPTRKELFANCPCFQPIKPGHQP